jgi:guanylate kinase
MADVYKAELQELTKPQTLAPGQQLYAGGKVIYTAPEKNSEFENLLAKSGLSEAEKTRLRLQRAQKEATHAPGNVVNLPPQEKAEQGDRGKLLVKQYEGISETARIGARTLPSLESNAAILDKGFDTGFGTEAKAAGAKVLGALGVKDAQNYATSAQTFLGNASSAILQKQLEQKGPQTESDAQRITQTGAQLGNTKEANKFFIDVAKEQIKRDVDQRNFYDKWWEQKKTYDGAENAWYSGEGGKSLFERPGLKKYISPTSAASQIPGQGPAAPAARNTAPAANVVTNPQFPGFSIGKP